MNGRAWRLDPHFLPTPAGALFALRVMPDLPQDEPPAVLFLPPFGEELNKCRPMMTAQARRLAQQGFECLILDLYGTGDSCGDFSDATWERWLDDLDRAWRLLSARSAVVHLLAVRSGALFVGALARTRVVSHARLALWQPVVKGADYWRQVVRLRVAADSLRNERPTPTPQQMLERDGRIEIAGYGISAMLATGLSQSNLESHNASGFAQVLWAETSSGAAGELSPGASRTVQQWRSDGVRVAAAAIDGEPFWMTTEIAMAPMLLNATTDFFVGATS